LIEKFKRPRKDRSTSDYSTRNKVFFVKSGQEYFTLLTKLIAQAKHFIHLQTYIFDDDMTGRLVVDALKKAAARNVKVYLLVDGYASQGLPRKFIKDLSSAGIEFRYFEPLLKSKYFYFGRRLHHKIFVVDAKYSVIGGINISNRYNDVGDIKAWLDMAVYVEGEIAQQLCILCWKTWSSFPLKMATTPCEEMTPTYSISAAESTKIRLRRNDWVRGKNEISASYAAMIRFASSHITILCSYFLPGKVIRRLLSDAAKRGVKITIITMGPSDVMVSKFAERWLYNWLFRNNITLYEYQPTVLHAKVAVCDSEWLTIGSYNVNDISAYASIELNLDLHNKKLALSLENSIDHIIEHDCQLISKEKYAEMNNIFKQFNSWLSYTIIHLIFHIFTFYYRQKP
jgi:cardiolipin synthase